MAAKKYLGRLLWSNMNKYKLSIARVRKISAAGIAVIAIAGLASKLFSAEPTNSVEPQTVSTDTNNVATKVQLTGAELYSMHCNRCHPERYPTERTAAQWKTIMLHMQVRANIPVKQSKLILQYLQDNSGR
jgi:hypothetical protein